jgi:hypothetical protein
MTAAIVLIVFFAVDIALVLGALFWLSRQRAIADITDLRYRSRRR